MLGWRVRVTVCDMPVSLIQAPILASRAVLRTIWYHASAEAPLLFWALAFANPFRTQGGRGGSCD